MSDTSDEDSVYSIDEELNEIRDSIDSLHIQLVTIKEQTERRHRLLAFGLLGLLLVVVRRTANR